MTEQPIRVLVVDDDVDVLESMVAILVASGFQVERASSGIEALQKARACDGNFQVALLDQVMAPVNGIEAMQALHRYYPSIEVIILTALRDMKPGERALALGAYRYMAKPCGVTPGPEPEELAFNVRMAARFGSEKRLRAALQSLNMASARFGEARDQRSLYLALYQEAKLLLPPLDGFIVVRWDNLNGLISFPFCHLEDREGSGMNTTTMSVVLFGGITEYVIENGSPLLLADGDEVFREQHGLDLPRNRRYAKSKIVVPLILGEKLIGTITALTYHQDTHYTPDHLVILQALANQAATRLQSIAQQQEAEQLARAVAGLIGQNGQEMCGAH